MNKHMESWMKVKEQMAGKAVLELPLNIELEGYVTDAQGVSVFEVLDIFQARHIVHCVNSYDALQQENARLRAELKNSRNYAQAVNNVQPADFPYTGDYLSAVETEFLALEAKDRP